MGFSAHQVPPPVAGPTGRGHVPRRATPLPNSISPDPVRQWVDLLSAGLDPAEMWPFEGAGHSWLLPDHHPADNSPGQKKKPLAVQQIYQALELLLAEDPRAPRSALEVHPALSGWISSAQGAICTPEWFLKPDRAVVICADNREADEVLAQLHQPGAHQCNNDDPFDSARWIAEEIEAPYPFWKFDGASPVRLASEVGPDDRWAHVYLSPGCRSLSRLELLPAVHEYPVSLHFVYQTQH